VTDRTGVEAEGALVGAPAGEDPDPLTRWVRDRSLPEGAFVVPVHFFVDNDEMAWHGDDPEVDNWEVWLGNDLWADARRLLSRPDDRREATIEHAPNGLRIVARRKPRI
jgi:hypothetical protein